MKFWLIALVVLVMVGYASWSRAEPPVTQPASPTSRSSPAEAKTTDEIVKALEPNKGYGQIQTAEFRRWGRRVFAIWYCPFSGFGGCCLSVYYYDDGKACWERCVDKLVDANGDLSPEMPSGDEIVFRTPGQGQKIVDRESLKTLPRKKP